MHKNRYVKRQKSHILVSHFKLHKLQQKIITTDQIIINMLSDSQSYIFSDGDASINDFDFDSAQESESNEEVSVSESVVASVDVFSRDEDSLTEDNNEDESVLIMDGNDEHSVTPPQKA